MNATITLDSEKTILSSVRRVYKTEGFIAMTKKVLGIDAFVSRAAESIFYADYYSDSDCFMAETEDKRFTLFFIKGHGDRLGRRDIIAYKYLSAGEDEGGMDRRLSEYMLSAKRFSLNLRSTDDSPDREELSRIYLVSSGDSAVNFPLLNEVQKKIVETENANMLVQGVAGSGKTNVCVEKIVYCACRNYRGKVLYTTFSRALLTETRNRVSLFLRNIEDFISFYEKKNVIFLDADHQKAVENKLGILFDTDDDARMVESLKRIAEFLKNKVDYKLIEDIYGDFYEKKPVVGESGFLKDYIGEKKNFKLSGGLEKIKNIAPEIVYKEIFGMIFGKYEADKPSDCMTKEEYIEARRDSFTPTECEIIYAVATDYARFLDKNGYTDNNAMSREILAAVDSPLYSVGIIDEAQDFTQVNLCLIKKLSRKLFCVGDALQMINPAYFNFGYIKRLMYGDVTGVSELRHNYRSTEKIETIAEKLGELNMKRFGTHSFVLKGESVKSSSDSRAVFVKEKDFATLLTDKRFENVTVVVASRAKKEQLRKKLSKVEILTVAEAKGLERNTVVLADVLGDNIDKWRCLKELSINRKTADENSVYRYYFNLFYVGISRAKQYLFVSEGEYPETFENLFNECFEKRNKTEALELLKEVAGKIELDDEEICDRIEKFCQLEQYENALYAADRLASEETRTEKKAYIYVHEHFLRYGRERDAGIEYWRRGLNEKAKETFIRSGDEELLPLIDACEKGGGALDVEIVKFFPLVKDNEVAKRLILETLNGDYNTIMDEQKAINESFKRKRRRQ